MPAVSPPPDPARGARATGAALIALIVLWQVAAALLVTLDTYDGYDTIINARYFLGDNAYFVLNRLPMMAWLIAPAEWLRESFGLHPLDVRPAHVVTGLLHIVTMVWVYRMLTAVHGYGWATLLAFASAVPTLVFFSYAPLISHDLAPGAAFLAILLLADRYFERGALLPLGAAVAIGVAAALVKYTFALFWFAVLIAYGAMAWTDPPRRRRWYGLVAGAFVAGAVTWLVLAVVLRHAYPDLPWYAKPWGQIAFHSGSARDDAFVWWVYLRNAGAYGWVSALLIVPALVMALHPRVHLPHARLHRVVAIAWIFCFVVMQSLALREVRYLAFLAPLTAFLLWAPWRAALGRRVLAAPLLLVGAFSLLPFFPYSPVGEALLIGSAHQRGDRLREFLAPLGHDAGRRVPVITTGSLVFLPAAPSPLVGDPYHRIVHFGVHHLQALLGYGAGEVNTVPIAGVDALRTWPPGTALIVSPDPRLTNPIGGAPAARVADAPRQILALDHLVVLEPAGDGYRTPDAARVEVEANDEGFILDSPGLASLLDGVNVLRLEGEADALRVVERRSPGQLFVPGALPAGTPLRIKGFRAVRVASPYGPEQTPVLPLSD